MEGWIKLHRKIMSNPIFNDLQLYRLWSICLMSASHKELEQAVGKQVVRLKPGQFVTGRFALSEAYNKGLPKSDKVSDMTVWRWLKTLESRSYVSIQMFSKFSVVTIDNWGVYQGEGEEIVQQNEQVFEQQVFSKCSTSVQQVFTNKNVKNYKNEKNGEKDIKPSPRKQRAYSEESPPYIMAVYLHEKIMSHAEASGVGHLLRNVNIQKWANEFRKLFEIDKVEEQLIREVIDWATSHRFWKTNILSASKLREKFADLALRMNQEKNGRDRSESGQGSIRHGSTTQKSAADSVTGGQLGWLNRDKRKVVPMREVQGSDWLPR